MESRMDKYYQKNIDEFARTRKNENLYKAVSKEISTLDNLPIPSTSKEIDMDGLKEIISSRDEYRKKKDLEVTANYRLSEFKEEPKQAPVEKVYDINVLLENAKNEIDKNNTDIKKSIVDDNFLTDMEEEEVPPSEDANSFYTKKNDVKEKVDSNSLPLDMLLDLKGSDDTLVTDPIIKEDVKEITKLKEGETFYSGSFNFSKKDFEDDSDELDSDSNDHGALKMFFLVFGILLLLGVIGIILYKYVI